MSKVRSDNISNRANDGAPKLTFGAEVPVGYGITGAGFINVSGVSTFSGNVSIAGTLTYEDVTNVDSVGLVTAGRGFRATTGGLIVTAGIATFGAIATFTQDAYVDGTLTAGLIDGGSY